GVLNVVLNGVERRLQAGELFRRLELRITLRHSKKALQSSAELIFGLGFVRRRGGLHGLGAELGNVLEGAFFVGGVTFHRLYQVGDEIVPALQWTVDARPGRVRPHPELHQAVVHPGQKQNRQPDYYQNRNEHRLPLSEIPESSWSARYHIESQRRKCAWR